MRDDNISPEVRGGYESFDDRGGFEDIYISYDSEVLSYFLDGAKALIDELDIKGFESILDVGTGTGNTALELAKRYPNCEVVGIDKSLGMLSQAKKKKNITNIKNISFLTYDWECLQNMNGKFDIITNSFGISFIKNVDKFADSVVSKLKEDSTFAFVNFDDNGFAPFGKELFSDLAKMSLLKNGPNALAPAAKKLIELMKKHGLKTQKIIHKELKYHIKKADDWWTIVSRTAIKENFFYYLTEKQIEIFKVKHLEHVQQLINSGHDEFAVPITIAVLKKN